MTSSAARKASVERRRMTADPLSPANPPAGLIQPASREAAELSQVNEPTKCQRGQSSPTKRRQDDVHARAPTGQIAEISISQQASESTVPAVALGGVRFRSDHRTRTNAAIHGPDTGSALRLGSSRNRGSRLDGHFGTDHDFAVDAAAPCREGRFGAGIGGIVRLPIEKESSKRRSRSRDSSAGG